MFEVGRGEWPLDRVELLWEPYAVDGSFSDCLNRRACVPPSNASVVSAFRARKGHSGYTRTVEPELFTSRRYTDGESTVPQSVTRAIAVLGR